MHSWSEYSVLTWVATGGRSWICEVQLLSAATRLEKFSKLKITHVARGVGGADAAVTT